MKRIWAQVNASDAFVEQPDGGVRSPPRCLRWRHLGSLILIMTLMGHFACQRSPRRLDRIRSSGAMRVAIDPTFAPFAMIDVHGQIVGLDADLADEIARRLSVEAHLVTTGYDALYDALTVDRADIIISALYPDLNRSSSFAFSRPYFNAGQVLVSGEDVEIANAADLAGRSVACIFGTTGHMEALRWETDLNPAPTIVTAEDATSAATLLRQGTVDAAIMDHVSALTLHYADTSLQIVTPAITDEPYTIAVRREDEELLQAIDEILQAMERRGEIAALIERWMHP